LIPTTPRTPPRPRTTLHHQVWPKRLPHSITPPATSLWHNLAVSALRFPDKPALVFFNRVLSYAEVHAPGRAPGGHACTAHGRAQGRPRGAQHAELPAVGDRALCHPARQRRGGAGQPDEPGRGAQALHHRPDAKVAITTADLAASWPRPTRSWRPRIGWRTWWSRITAMLSTSPRKASDAAPCRRLARLAGHAPRAAGAGRRQVVMDWADAVAGTGAASAHGHAARPGRAALHQRHHRPAQGLHAPAPSIMHNAVASCLWGGSTFENVTLSVVPMFHITGMVSVMHASIYGSATWSSCRAGTASWPAG
jgi:fatty-acyl-CoA synthase